MNAETVRDLFWFRAVSLVGCQALMRQPPQSPGVVTMPFVLAAYLVVVFLPAGLAIISK